MKGKHPVTAATSAAPSPPAAPPAAPPGRCAWLSGLALVLALGVVAARAAMNESLRDPLVPQPGMVQAPRAPGPATGIFLDLLAAVPALLVLARRWLEPGFALRARWWHVPLALLPAWMLLSTLWAADRYAALVESLHFAGAMALLWAMIQLVRSWPHVRLVAGVAAGALLILVAHGLNQRLVEHPETVRQWNDPTSPNSRKAYLQRQGLDEDDFGFRQFERKVLAGELAGFSRSPNTYAALLVMLLLVAAGAALDRAQQGGRLRWAWPAAFLLAGAAAAFCIRHTHSRLAMLTPLLGLAMLGGLALPCVRAWLEARWRLAFVAGVAAFFLGAAAVIGHGAYHGNLVDRSLTFRWHYWTGAARLAAERPLTGVGWGSFGYDYLRVRLPEAVEEVKDPHDLFARALAELGAVGAALMLAWALALAWGMSRPESPPPVPPPLPTSTKTTADRGAARGWALLAGIPLAAGLLHLSLAHDWAYPEPSWLLLGALASAGWVVLLLAGVASAVGGQGGASGQRMALLTGRAPWTLRAMGVAVALFFLHNLIDFSLFETGPMYVLAMVAGCVLGARWPEGAERPAVGRGVALAGLIVALVAWLAVAGGAWLPVARAASVAAEADELVASSANEHSGVDLAQLERAARWYEDALAILPLNADPAARAAAVLADAEAIRREARLSPGGHDGRIRSLLARARQINPRDARLAADAGRYEATRTPADAAAVREAFDAALRLDPRNVPLRLRYADALESLGDRDAAAAQIREALAQDDRLPTDEPRRLAPARRAALESRLRSLPTSN